MARMYETLPTVGRLQMALEVMSATRLAQTFAALVGQFYDRSEFDTLARQVSNLYDLESNEHAQIFRSQLDQRLYDRFHAPVAWDIDAHKVHHAA
ncbi:MAG: hypothetical protein ACR2JC_18780 [Chloroflexota bacterium]